MFRLNNYRDVKEMGDYGPVPPGVYVLKILEAKEGHTKNGDPKANVELEIQNQGSYFGRKVWHTVTFFDAEHKAAGMSKHWLRCIEQPYEGDEIEVDSSKWPGKRIEADIDIESYPDKEGKLKKKNTVKNIRPVSGQVITRNGNDQSW